MAGFLHYIAFVLSEDLPTHMGYFEHGGYEHVLLFNTHFSPSSQSKF